jgi:hypothetical protein
MSPFRATWAAAPPRSRALPLSVVAVFSVLFTMTTLLPFGPRSGAATPAAADHGNAHAMSHPRAALNSQQQRFHDQMRKLWEDHVTWTRLAIVTFAADTEGFDTTAARLLQNQSDIGDAIKPFYGEAAGNQLTTLLNDHILIAVDLLGAAKAGDTAAVDAADTRWTKNANQIADLLAAANPRNWIRSEMRAMMRTHLTQTFDEAAHELNGSYQASVTDYERVHAHILKMADVVSSGVMAQFPSRFR